MTNENTIDGPRMEPASGEKANKLVILLHGYGADGNDLIGLAPYLARVLPDAYFVAPNAPEPCGMAPTGRQWFPIDPTGSTDRLAGAESAAPILNQFIDDEMARLGLSEADTLLIGFSQGTMMALHVGLRRGGTLAGILGYSGLLAAPEALTGEISAKPPVLLIHGDMDEMLPVRHLHEAVAALGELGVNVEWHVSQGAGHTIAQDGLELGIEFLGRTFADHA
jgi:phospholipase/carboxylesterase